MTLIGSLLRVANGDPAPTGLHSGSALRDRQREVQLRRRRADVLPELPPKTVTRVPLTLTGRQRESYERAEREGVLGLRERGDAVRVENVLELIVHLKQICNVDPVSGRSATLDDLALMRKHSPPHVQVKAAGGVRDLDTLLKVRDLGVTRCGASRTKEMLDECRQRLNLPQIEAISGAAGAY